MSISISQAYVITEFYSYNLYDLGNTALVFQGWYYVDDVHNLIAAITYRIVLMTSFFYYLLLSLTLIPLPSTEAYISQKMFFLNIFGPN